MTMKLSNEDISRLWHLLVPYFDSDFDDLESVNNNYNGNMENGT
jgi:hypothetical protein